MYPFSFKKHIWKLLILASAVSFSQSVDSTKNDTLSGSESYGIRIGADLSRPLLGILKDGYSGIELVGDYRISEKMYVAAELGNESKTVAEILNNFETSGIVPIYNLKVSGSYLKAGIDINTYENWYGMKNNIIVGARYAFSSFQTDINSYSFFNSNRYWNPDGFDAGNDALQQLSGLNASWLEILLGIKTELVANIYLSASVRIGKLMTRSESEIMPHLWIPGFNRVTDGSSFGTSFNYTLSYMVPLYRKAKAKKSIP
jgi:hypothetical protein